MLPIASEPIGILFFGELMLWDDFIQKMKTPEKDTKNKIVFIYKQSQIDRMLKEYPDIDISEENYGIMPEEVFNNTKK